MAFYPPVVGCSNVKVVKAISKTYVHQWCEGSSPSQFEYVLALKLSLLRKLGLLLCSGNKVIRGSIAAVLLRRLAAYLRQAALASD